MNQPHKPQLGDSLQPHKPPKRRRLTSEERRTGKRIYSMSWAMAAGLVDAANIMNLTPEKREEMIQQVRRVNLDFTRKANKL